MRPGVNDSHIVHLLPNVLRVSGDALAVFHLAASSLALNAYTDLIEMPIIMVQKLRQTYQRSQLCFHFAETKSDHKCPRFSFFFLAALQNVIIVRVSWMTGGLAG